MPTKRTTPNKKTDRQLLKEHERFAHGSAPRPKYESGPTDEPVNDSHSRSSDPESPYLKDFIPGTARG